MSAQPKSMSVTLTAHEVDNLLKLLGGLPTSSNAWPLMHNIASQVQTQLNAPDQGELPAV